MSYLEEFQKQIQNRDFSKFLQLWEEYCTSDSVETEEFLELLRMVKNSELAKSFGQFIETALPLWETIKDKKESYSVLKLLIDLQTTNTPHLADTALKAIQETYENDPEFNARLRLVGLRARDSFQGALANYDLLAHMAVGKFVFHTGGWGTGEIVDFSAVREQIGLEFENVTGRKHVTFANAFKTLVPLDDQNFLVRRFAEPDALEADARENPVQIIKILLRDLGPKTASEIKDELCDLVIPEEDWSKWWQAVRAKIKKDPMIESPESLREPFRIRKGEISPEERFRKAIHNKTDINDVIQICYNYVRDMPAILKNPDTKNSIKERLLALLSKEELTKGQELQVYIFLETSLGHKVEGKALESLIQKTPDIEDVINDMEIIAFKKRALMLVHEYRKDWTKIFLSMLFTIQPNPLRDYILKELDKKETRKALEERLQQLCKHPSKDPEALVWYFQKVSDKEIEEGLPFSDKEGQCAFFEAFLVLFNYIESKQEWRDLTKKMYNIISGQRYAVVRHVIDGSTMDFIKEFLLLASKCHTFSDHDQKILRSLAEVAHPSLASTKSRKTEHDVDGHTIWTTEEGYHRIQDRIKQIGTVEIVDVAKEIEAARALGDLRENSEYKFAQERRHRLQGELKNLSEQLGRARIITKDDIHPEEVGIGSIVDVMDAKKKKIRYTILGPWDANPDENILSIQSKFAQAMLGCKTGEDFRFRDDEYTVVSIKSFLDK